MPMDIVDEDISRAERAASPERFRMYDDIEAKKEQATATGDAEKLDRMSTRYSTSSGASSSIATQNQGVSMSRINTSRDLDRHPTSLSRIQTQKSQHQGTVGRSTTARQSKKPLPNFGGGKEYPPMLPGIDDYVVEFDGPDDPLHPQNWPMSKKLAVGTMLGYTTLLAAFGSSIFSSATVQVSEVFGVSTEVGLLGLSLYVLGFATGPIIWAPFSELRGRREPLIVGMFGFTLFQAATATGENLQTVLISRFFGGLFASSPLAVVAAVFSDMFDNRTRGTAIAVFSMAVFSGPLMAPFIGGFMVANPNLGWRWTSYLMTILGAVAFLLDLFLLPETYPPIVLVTKASELRRRTLNWGIHAKQEEIEVDFRELINKNFSRPLRILVGEPIVLLLSIYMAFIYGLLYLFLTAYPIVFQQIHGFSAGISGPMLFGMIIGEIFAAVLIILEQPSYNRKLAANNGIPVPEWRLPPVIAGGAAFAAGLFWFGWSGYRSDIHWIVPALSGLLTGFGLLSIFLQSLNYIVDAYLMFAASAIAANTFLRSLAGAVFPLFSQYMFKAIGINWSGTLLGCVAVLLVPIPVLFYKYGHKIREKSKFAPTGPKPLTPPSDEESSHQD
ncbi:MAG: hypothetical protein GOMPHAMPRED_007902 [Gomphillus americanus]|uniref:Major facilitator superfamily (MFS) profile domain-containing protein n=1 Tax=Gomphillus americanus TaxID=1940652 RepID=A0A8H3F315_9LECA|nr:MAG: hypothetical protein GOMPHAMPRED_007902 [Gomphillus americanus]